MQREPISVLVADFDNKTGDPVFDGVVEQALGLGIEGASFITAYPRGAALRAAAVIKPGAKLDETTARLVARREGVGLILAGDIEARGATLSHHHARGSRGRHRRPACCIRSKPRRAARPRFSRPSASLAGQVRTALGDTAVPTSGPAANETFTAANLEAAQAYAQGAGAAGRRQG